MNFTLTCGGAIITLGGSSWNIHISKYEKMSVHQRWSTYGRHIRRSPSQAPQKIHHPEEKILENWQFRYIFSPDRSSLWMVLQTSHDWTPVTVIWVGNLLLAKTISVLELHILYLVFTTNECNIESYRRRWGHICIKNNCFKSWILKKLY